MVQMHIVIEYYTKFRKKNQALFAKNRKIFEILPLPS